ncbi:MAG: gliding motility-associated C-terminal domain-containing protein, partial [Tunicatimonas sp.]
VVVEDNNTGCTTSDTLSLQELITYPEPQATATARTYCATLNGTISASVGGNTANYTFDLYEGTAATGTPVAQSTDGSFNGLDSIEYTIVAISTLTGCATPAPQAFTIKVPGNTKAPVVLPTVVDQSSCDPTTPNGSISLSVDGAAATTSGYTFAWLLPDGTTASGTTLTDLAYGSYSLTVTSTTSGCDTTLIIPVENNILEDAPLTLVTSDVTDCTPYNGQVEVTQVNGTATDLTDYTFTWYEIAESGFDSTVIVGVTSATLSGQEPGTFSVQGFNTRTKCTTSSQRATVGTTVPQPVINIVPAGPPVDDCFDRDGVFELDVKLGGANVVGQYTYDWYLGSTVEPSSYVHTGATITGIVAGTFTIVATSVASHGCATTAVIDMTTVVDFLPVILGDPTATHIEQCINPANTGTVSANVEIIFAPDAQHDDQDDYAFYWFAGKQLPPLPGGFIGEIDTIQALTSILDTSKPSARGTAGAGHTLTGLAPGFYSVAVFNIADGCYSSKFTEVKQIAREPIITLVDNQPQTLCSSADGRLEVSASKRNGDTTPNAGPPAYSYAWYAGTSASGTPISNAAVLANQTAGQYTVLVTDLQTNCDIEQTYTILDERDLPAISTSIVVGNNLCQPVYPGNGTITVEQIVSGPTIVTSTATFESDYHFYLYDDESDFVAATPATNAIKNQPAGANNYIFTDLAPGTYHVAATDNTNGCVSPFLHDVIVPDYTPVMTFSIKEQESFVECTGADEGRLRVEVQNATGPFTFTWYDGNSTSDPVITTDITNVGRSSTIENLKGGEYTLQVVDQNNQACTISQFFTVPVKVVSPILSVNKLSDQTNCNLPDGSIEVTGIVLNGNAENLGDYTYTWYQGSLDPASATRFGSNFGQGGTAYNNLPAGTFFISATANFADGCPTDPVQVVITDESVELQVIDDFISEPILGCDPSQFEEGGIDIRVLNSTNFTTEWFRGDQVDVAQHIAFRIDENGNNVPLDNATSIGGSTNGNLLVAGDTLTALPPGVYTVRVTDNNNIMCPAVRQYTIQGIAVPLDAFPSAKPQTSCLADNGAVALTINGGKGDYYVNWYAGENPTGTPINANNAYRVDNLPAGRYTVSVIDSADLSCEPVVRPITVEDRRGNDLQITVSPDFPMTNCDDANPNGQLSAKISRPLTRYEFFWYQGTNTAANPVAFGPTVTNLGENTYSVIARDRITGCLSDPFTGEIITLLDSGLMPAPTVRMLSPVTRCANPDGSAQATLDSALLVDPNIDYEYIWSDAQGNVILSTSRTDQVTQLDTGTYSVVVRNTITGCLSLPGEVYIGLQLKTPEFEIVTTVSSCDQPSGTLSLNLFEAIEIVNIAWVTPYGEANGFFLDEQPAGKYVATLTDASGCQYTQEASVLPNIEIYNAVSPNGDQKNDIFTVSCIEAYQNNIVRIYNRAGSLVYQHRGYDNQTVFFNGFGNQGLYLGKKELPDGTYFYIVDKQNGDQPLSGYLELLR